MEDDTEKNTINNYNNTLSLDDNKMSVRNDSSDCVLKGII